MRCAKRLEELFPGSRVTAAWSAQDCMTPDHIPYIGSYSSSRPDWLIATGFQKWGMTTAMAAAQILCDRLCSKGNPYADLFRPDRFSAKSIPGMAEEGKQAFQGLGKRFFQKFRKIQLKPFRQGMAESFGKMVKKLEY